MGKRAQLQLHQGSQWDRVSCMPAVALGDGSACVLLYRTTLVKQANHPALRAVCGETAIQIHDCLSGLLAT